MITTQPSDADALPERQDGARAGACLANHLATDALARLLGVPLSIAAALLEEYGSLTALRLASAADLACRGLTPRRAEQVVAALDLAVAVWAERPPVRPRVTTPADAARVLLPEMGLLEREQLRVLLLDTKNCLIDVVTVYQGTLSSCPVRVGEILTPAVRQNAAGVVVAHNHPSGDVSPSSEDIALTRALVRAGALLDVPVHDHLVVAAGRYTSLREQGLGWS